jgi:hypothetical protein
MEVPSAMLKESIPTRLGEWWGTKNWLHVFIFSLTGSWLAGEQLLQNRCWRVERVRMLLPTALGRAATVATNPITNKPWIDSLCPALQHVSYVSWQLAFILCVNKVFGNPWKLTNDAEKCLLSLTRRGEALKRVYLLLWTSTGWSISSSQHCF